VAYVRFASVYREFKDPSEFAGPLESLAAGAAPRKGGPQAAAHAPLFPEVAPRGPKRGRGGGR